MSDRVEGAMVAPAMPMTARLAMSISEPRRERGEQGGRREARRPEQEEPATADAIAERAHRDEEASDKKAIDVDHPEQLDARRSQHSPMMGIARLETVKSIA